MPNNHFENYTKSTYGMSLDEALNNHLLFDEKGNKLQVEKYDKKKPIIAIKDNKANVLYLNDKDEFEEKKEIDASSDKEPLKWYKVIIAMLYAMFKLIKELIAIINPNSLKNACEKALKNNFQFNKNQLREINLQSNEPKITNDSPEKNLKVLNDINKEQTEREKELLDIKKNLKKIDNSNESMLIAIKNRLNRVDMSLVEERIKLSRIKGYENEKAYESAKKAEAVLEDKLDMLDYFIFKSSNSPKNYFQDKKETSAVKEIINPVNVENPNRKPIEIKELKPNINPIDRIFENLDKDLTKDLKRK